MWVDLVAGVWLCEGHFVLTHLLVGELKKSAAEEDGDARVVVVTSSLHDVDQSKKRGRESILIVTVLLECGRLHPTP